MKHNVLVYILIAATVTSLIRILPMTVFRKKITNRFVRSFLFYVPYATLAVMTFPAMLYAPDHLLSGILATAAGLLYAWKKGNIFVNALLCCAVVLLCEGIFALAV